MVGRAQYYDDIMMIDIAESVSEKYKNTRFYLLESKASDMTYISHTTQQLGPYIDKKRNDQKCMSRMLFACSDVEIFLLENRSCSGLDEAEAYELHLMSKFPNCVNKNLLSQRVAQSPYTREYIDKTNYYALVEHLRLHEPSSERMQMFADAVGRMKVQEGSRGRLFIGTRYHQAPFGGRRYAEGSSLWDQQKPGKTTVQSMWCQLRQWLLGDYHDLDIVNCIPTIMQQVFKLHEIDPASYSTLTQYVGNRADVLADISSYYKCTKGQAKTLVIRLYNGGGVKGWLQECNLNTNTPDSRFVRDFRAQLTPLIDLINNKPTYAQIKNHCSENKNEYNARVSTFANVLFYHEAIVLDAIVASIKRQGLSVNGLIFDGTAVAAPRGTDMLAVIQQAEADVLTNTGFSIKLLEKPMYGMNKLPLEALMYAVENHTDLGPIPEGRAYVARPIELPEIPPPTPVDVGDGVITMGAITP